MGVFFFDVRSEYKQMLKQRKHSPFDDQASPDGSHYLGKYLRLLFDMKQLLNMFLRFERR